MISQNKHRWIRHITICQWGTWISTCSIILSHWILPGGQLRGPDDVWSGIIIRWEDRCIFRDLLIRLLLLAELVVVCAIWTINTHLVSSSDWVTSSPTRPIIFGLSTHRSHHPSLAQSFTPGLKFACLISFVFGGLPEPNRACLVGVYAVTLDPLLSLCGIIYVTWYTRLLSKAASVTFRWLSVYQITWPTRHALLGSGRPPKTKL